MILEKASRRLAAQWARANAPIVEADLLTGLDRAAQRSVNCTFSISRELTKANLPYLLSCYGGEVFVFALNQRQAKGFKIEKHQMTCLEGGPSLEFAPDMDPLIEISDLEVADADGLEADQPIVGAISYAKRLDVGFPGKICLSLEFDVPGRCRMTSFYYPPQGLLPEGELRFTFSPVIASNASQAIGYSGPVVGYVRFTGTMNPQTQDGRVPLSNSCAALIEVI